MKKHLFLSAYLRTNPGDDMMVLTLLRRYPGEQFFLYCLFSQLSWLFHIFSRLQVRYR